MAVGAFDHGQRDTVLDAAAGIEKLLDLPTESR
jgi:hypothetical protein